MIKALQGREETLEVKNEKVEEPVAKVDLQKNDRQNVGNKKKKKIEERVKPKLYQKNKQVEKVQTEETRVEKDKINRSKKRLKSGNTSAKRKKKRGLEKGTKTPGRKKKKLKGTLTRTGKLPSSIPLKKSYTSFMKSGNFEKEFQDEKIKKTPKKKTKKRRSLKNKTKSKDRSFQI